MATVFVRFSDIAIVCRIACRWIVRCWNQMLYTLWGQNCEDPMGGSRILVQGAQRSFDPKGGGGWAPNLLKIDWKLHDFEKRTEGQGGPLDPPVEPHLGSEDAVFVTAGRRKRFEIPKFAKCAKCNPELCRLLCGTPNEVLSWQGYGKPVGSGLCW